jgi:POT family proton-dependent oligopeptide transporter
MRAILVLYMVASVAEGGLGWSDKEALSLYGMYVMLVYVMSIPGGIIADRYLGARKSVMFGGLLLCVGHGLMAIPALWGFYSALFFIVMGVGMLKPNISTMVGALYEKNDPRKDSAFTIFYMGINIGAFIAGISVAWLSAQYGWHYGFASAGIGMVIGQITYYLGQKHLGTAGLLIKEQETDKKAVEEVKVPLIPVEKRRLVAVGASFLVVIVFWAAFEQAGGLMSIYTERYTDRTLGTYTVPSAMFQSLNPFYIITLAPVMAWFWLALAKRKREPSSLFKMGFGTVIMGLGFLFMVGASMERGEGVGVKSSMNWLVFAYLFHTIGELALSPVSLSYITKMAPKRMGSSVMGLYFAATGVGGWAAAKLGSYAQDLGDLSIFGGICVFTVIFGSILMIASRFITKYAATRPGEATEAKPADGFGVKEPSYQS